MKLINANYQIEVGYWTQRNYLQDYKIYVMVICIFYEDFVSQIMLGFQRQSMANTPHKLKL